MNVSCMRCAPRGTYGIFVILGLFGAPGIALGFEQYAPNFGMWYEFVPLTDGTQGAQLTRMPFYGQGASQLGLSVGDVVLRADGMPFYSHADVCSHWYDTTVVFSRAASPGLQAGRTYLTAVASMNPIPVPVPTPGSMPIWPVPTPPPVTGPPMTSPGPWPVPIPGPGPFWPTGPQVQRIGNTIDIVDPW